MGNVACVDNGKSSVSEADPLIHMDVLEIRPAVRQTSCSGGYIDLAELADEVESEYSGDATHERKIRLGFLGLLDCRIKSTFSDYLGQ